MLVGFYTLHLCGPPLS